MIRNNLDLEISQLIPKYQNLNNEELEDMFNIFKIVTLDKKNKLFLVLDKNKVYFNNDLYNDSAALSMQYLRRNNITYDSTSFYYDTKLIGTILHNNFELDETYSLMKYLDKIISKNDITYFKKILLKDLTKITNLYYKNYLSNEFDNIYYADLSFKNKCTRFALYLVQDTVRPKNNSGGMQGDFNDLLSSVNEKIIYNKNHILREYLITKAIVDDVNVQDTTIVDCINDFKDVKYSDFIPHIDKAYLDMTSPLEEILENKYSLFYQKYHNN